uniref:PIH1 domain-containing protein 1 n=1 Tax=Glossina brevipalpis TaxID=37001 RepID=A0A1A9W373_9MUSC
MSSQNNFFDVDNILLRGNVKFIQNDFEESFFEHLDAGSGTSAQSVAPPDDFKIIQPRAGCCIKTFKINSNEKYFINVCQTEEITAPEDLTDVQLTAILNSDEPSSFRIPMSIAEPRITKDKSNNPVEAVDIALNPKFFAKIEKSLLFRDFFSALIAEALNDKYNVQIKLDKVIILNNRKFIGTLVTHRIRTGANENATSSSKSSNERDTMEIKIAQASTSTDTLGTNKPLIEEINSNVAEVANKTSEENKEQRPESVKQQVTETALITPEFKFRARIRNKQVEEIQAEFYLPKCLSSQEITLDIGEDRILLESTKRGYIFDKFVDYQLNPERARAIFDKSSKMLQLRVPVIPTE